MDKSFQIHRRLHALNNLPKRTKDDVHFSLVTSIDKKTATIIRSHIIDLLDNIHKIAEKSPSEDVYSACFDFFKA